MTKTESIIRSIVGPADINVERFARSADVLGSVLYVHHLPQDELNLSKHVYPKVMQTTGLSKKTIEKSVERLTNRCLDHGDKERLWEIIGKPLEERPMPFELLIYIAHYSFLDKPYYTITRKRHIPLTKIFR